MTPQQEALAAAWLAELWPVCREVPRDVRAGWNALAADRDNQLAEWAGEDETPLSVAS